MIEFVCILAGAGAGWISCQLYRDRLARQTEASYEAGIARMADALAAKEEALRADLESRMQSHVEGLARERESFQEVNAELSAHLESTQNRLMQAVGSAPKPPPQDDRVAADPGFLQEQVDSVLDARPSYDTELARLQREGFTETQARQYLNGELEELPPWSDRLDRMVLDDVTNDLGLPHGGR